MNGLEGLEAPASAFEQALVSGRLHHAWLLTGPEGLGKATLAHRAARRLLGARSAPEDGPLGSPNEDPVARLIAAGAHPDLLVLERRSEDGKLKRSISVEDARRLPEFFAKTPAIGQYRVAVIDSADDLNMSSANALLKTLEEPSGKGVLLLVSHAPGGLLPTIRSRCRRLRFAPWSEASLVDFVARRLGLESADAERLARLAAGAPGRALALHAAGALELDAEIAAVIAKLPGRDDAAVFRLADGFRGGEGVARFGLTMEVLAERVRCASAALAGSAGGERWAAAWQAITALVPQVDAVNLDRADALSVAIDHVRDATRVQAAPC